MGAREVCSYYSLQNDKPRIYCVLQWNALRDSTGNIPQTLAGILPPNRESQDLIHRLPRSVDTFVGFKAPGVLIFSVDCTLLMLNFALVSYIIEIYADCTQ